MHSLANPTALFVSIMAAPAPPLLPSLAGQEWHIKGDLQGERGLRETHNSLPDFTLICDLKTSWAPITPKED